jgi:hypothetical protein
MPHELTVSFTVDTPKGKRIAVIPSVVGGKRLSPDEARELFISGTIKPIGLFATLSEAEKFVKDRNEAANKMMRRKFIFEKE